MAFGRDGSELELNILSIQNRTYRDALEEIVEECSDKKAVSIAKGALKKADDTEKRLG